MASGWIKLYRQILDCVIWDDEDEPYDKRSAWIYLLVQANHKDREITFDGETMIVKRGQIVTSVRKLSKLWMWSNDKTLRFLRKLEKHRMIVRDANSRRTLITIVNYGFYQGDEDTSRTLTSTVTEHKQVTNKKDKNVKKIINRTTFAAAMDMKHNYEHDNEEELLKG